MKILIVKKPVLISMILFVAGLYSFLGITFSLPITVYRDRYQWEKVGAIVWEAHVPEKLIALTFDDGPSPTFTAKILDLLAQYEAKGTFFVIGKQAEKYPEIIQRENAEGHEISNHTYSHCEVSQMTQTELENDLKSAHQAIYKVIRKNMNLFRPTGGFYDEKVVKAAQLLNYLVVIWTWGQDSRDWTYISGEKIAARIIKTVKPGNIVLFHDRGGDRSNTVRALEMILPALQEQGYHFVTVSDLLHIQNHKKVLDLK